jgi:hypothetical protein
LVVTERKALKLFDHPLPSLGSRERRRCAAGPDFLQKVFGALQKKSAAYSTILANVPLVRRAKPRPAQLE